MGGGGGVKNVVKKAAIATGIGGLVGGAAGAITAAPAGAAVGVGENIGDAAKAKIPDAPELGDVDSELASDAELQGELRRRRGRASTILTGQKGIAAVGDSNIRRKTLLAF